MGHLTNPEETERQRIAGNKAAKKRMPVDKKGKYWWSEYTDPFTKPVDKVLKKSLGPAAEPVQGLLALTTPAESINEVLNKPTAGNMITAATETALTAAGLKTLGAPAAKVAQNVNRTTPGGNDMGKYKVATSIFETGKDAVARRKKLLTTGKKKAASASPKVQAAPPNTATSSPSAPMPKPSPTANVNKAASSPKKGAAPKTQTRKRPETPKPPPNPSLLQR